MWIRSAVKLFQKFNSLPPFWLFLKKHIWNISEESEEISDYHDNDEKNYSYSDEENGIKGDFLYDEDHKEDEEDKDLDLDKSKLKDTQFHLDSAIGQFNQKLYEELDKTESGNIIFSPFRSDIWT